MSMTATSATEARRTLYALIERVNDDRDPIEILSKRGDAILMAADEYRSLVETAHLLRSPANAKRLFESMDQARRGDVAEHDLAE